MLYTEGKALFLAYISSYCASDTLEYYSVNFHIFETYLQASFDSIEIDLASFSKSDYIGYVGFLRQKTIKNTSVRTYCRAIKVFFRYLYFEGYLEQNLTERVKYPKPDKGLVIPLTASRVAVLEQAMSHSPLYVRNILIFHLCLDCGLRLGEVCSLRVSDVDFDNRFLKVCDSKNNKSRIVPLPVLVDGLLRDYLRFRVSSSSVLLILDRYGCPITVNALKQVFSKLKRYDSDIHAHLLRHTFATSFIMGGGNLEILRVLMGHSSYNVTKEYLHVAAQMNILNYDIYKLDKCMFRNWYGYSPNQRD